MKFADGFWLNQRGYEVNYASQAYEITPVKNGLNVYATSQYIQNRGMTLGGPCLDITFTSTQKDVIKVSIEHYKGTLDNQPRFELEEDQGYTPEITEKGDCWELVSGDTKLVIGKFNWNVQYYYKDKRLTGGAWRSASIINESKFKTSARLNSMQDDTFWSYPQDARSTYIREQLSMNVGEYFYGFGEKFTPFVKNGQNVETWNSDGGTCSDQSYKCIPFYVSSTGYGVLVNSSDKVSFEVCSDTVSKVSFTVPGEKLEYFVIGGANIGEVLSNYTTLTGKPALPPAYTFGLWLTTSFTTKYDEETVTSFIDGMAERDIPLQVFHFDCFWMKEFHWSDFVWDERVFPDPEGMLKRIKAKGLNICVWINSYIGQESVLFAEGVEKGYFVKRTNGDVWQWDMWQPGMALVDFTNPDACKWFQSKLEVLLDMGVDCFKTDFGERIPTEDIMYFDGSDPKKMHNYYTYLYNKCVYELLERKRGKGEAVLFARSATAGGQKFPVHWGGDCWSDYESMEESLRGGLSLCMSGFGFWSHDIGGFESTSTPDVYKRWAAFGLLSSHSRLHGSSSYRVPWAYDEEAVDVVRTLTLLKASLMPYLYRNAIYASQTGIPMMRSMVLEFTADRNCSYLDKQYMMGDSLLVAPVFNDESIAEYYLPAGTWTNYFTGKKYTGGCWYSDKCGYLEIPLFVKENSIVAVNPDADRPDYDYADNVTFRVYEPSDCTTTVYDMKANADTTISVRKSGNELTITITGTKKCNVELVNLATETDLTGLTAGTYTVTIK